MQFSLRGSSISISGSSSISGRGGRGVSMEHPVQQSQHTIGSVVRRPERWCGQYVCPYDHKPVQTIESVRPQLTMGSVVKAMAVVAAQLWPGARLTALVACAFSTHTNSLHGAGTQYGVG